MEKSRSWPSAHDWKSCIPQKGIEGSNPSFSAIKKKLIHPDEFLFYPEEGFEDLNATVQWTVVPEGLTEGNLCFRHRRKRKQIPPSLYKHMPAHF